MRQNRLRPSGKLLIFLLLWLLMPGTAPPALAAEGAPPIHTFQAVDAQCGWLWQGETLYFTADRGLHWRTITPPSVKGAWLHAPFFLDPQRGWVVSLLPTAEGQPAYWLSLTTDGGHSWETFPLSLFQKSDPNRYAAQLSLEFVDAQHGWLVVKRVSSSNFSLGRLFRTQDGGRTWEPLPIPIAEPVHFISPQRGWVAGGPAGDRLYATEDGGESWHALHLAEEVRHAWLPRFSDERHGFLPLQTETGIVFYATQDGGASWFPARTFPLSREDIPAYPLPAQIGLTPAQMGLAPGWVLSEVKPLSEKVGWGMAVYDSCEAEGIAEVCFHSQRLLFTEDGGQHWRPLPLPDGMETVTTSTGAASQAQSLPASGRTSILQGQGFDKCEVATLSQLQTWRNQSPYRAVNLYIGGACRACSNHALSSSYVAQMSAQGWKLIPTWVGPQSAGYGGGCSSRISNDTATAYQQGINEANAALSVAGNLGLTLDNGSGTVIYYDLEGYTNNSTYRNAAKAFISGWTARLQATGNQAGVYGSACASYLDDFATISHVPNVLWPAAWYKNSYYANATVWNVPCVPNSHWNNHQRIRQYAGGHTESWGGVGLNIDCNAIDGVVADLQVDAIPPVTTLDRLEGDEGENGWYRSPVQLQITASDSGGSGFKALYYRFNEGNWSTSFNPSLALTLTTQGQTIFDYYAEDNAGNKEAMHRLYIRIDSASPTGSLMINNGATSTPSAWVLLHLGGEDATSGVTQLRLRNSIHPWAAWRPYDKAILWALPAINGSTFTVQVQFKDEAGNLSPVYEQTLMLDLYPQRPASAHYHLSRSTWGSATTQGTTNSYRLNGTAGQLSIAGEMEEANYHLISGFWSPLATSFKLYLPLILKP